MQITFSNKRIQTRLGIIPNVAPLIKTAGSDAKSPISHGDPGPSSNTTLHRII